MIRKCFNEEGKASNKNYKVNGSAVCFLYNIFFRLLGGSGNNRMLSGVEYGLADVTGTVRIDHRLLQHKLRVLFATGQWHCPPRSAGTHAMSQPAAAATRLFCISLGSAVTFFR